MDSSTHTTPATTTIRNPYLNLRNRTVQSEEISDGGAADDQQSDSNDVSEKVECPRFVEEKKDDESLAHNRELSTGTTSSGTPTPNTGLAFWERLPSKNLSFGSAEILTVDECVKHSAFYHGRHVRVTGQLHQRTFIGDDVATPRHVLLELMDPIVVSPQLVVTPAKTPSKPLYNTPGLLLSTTKTPNSIEKTSYKTPIKTIGPRKTTSNTSVLRDSSTKTPGSCLVSGKRKRPWFATSARKKTPPQIAPKLFLKVIADPELPRLATIAPSGASKVMVMGIMLENGWLQARFVSLVDPCTDMTLYVNALHARRRCLYQRYKELAGTHPLEVGDDKTKDSTILIGGCGPPPYGYLDKEESK